jgi:undecaprenyl-diphosphatase
VFLLLLHPARWRASLLLLICDAIVAGNDVIKWIVGRTRPYKLHNDFLEPFVFRPFQGGSKGTLSTNDLCFPSGHAALAFASAAALSILLPRWRWVFYAIAAIVAVERVLEDAHWLSDTVGAAALGIGGAWIVRRLWWDKQSPKLSHG